MSNKDEFLARILPANLHSHNEYLGIPWLYKNPREQVLQWRQKIKSVADYYKAQALQSENELRLVDLLPSTKKRLSQLNYANQKSAELFNELLKPLLLNTDKLNDKSPAGLSDKIFQEKIPRQQTVMAYHQTVFRDWVWGHDEIAAQLELVRPLFKNTQKLLVLGAGACGLPLALHQSLSNCETLAVDINPVLFFLVKRLLSGEDLTLVEFPKLPIKLTDTALEHHIKGVATPARFHMVLADAQTLELQPQSFDGLLTPWFIDIVPRPFRDLARHLNQSLAIGGHWVNIGPLAFERNKLSELHSIEEVKETLEESGFKLESSKMVTVPYLHSPHSMLKRNDQVLVFSAVKVKNSKKPQPYEYLPEWLRDWQKPIPAQTEIMNIHVKAQVFAQATQYVNGQNSLETIAQTFSTQFQMNIDDAREALYTFFVNIYEQHIFREF